MENKNKKSHQFVKQVGQMAILVLLMVALAGVLRLVEMVMTEEEVVAKERVDSVTAITQSGYIGYGSYQPLPQNNHLLSKTESNPQVLGFSFSRTSVQPAWQASQVSALAKTVGIEAGKSLTFWVDFKNTGTASWSGNGDHFVALNVDGANNDQSLLRHSFWISSYRPAKLPAAEISPGETARFYFAIQAPDQPGQYQADFGLVAENLLWIPGGKISITVNVPEPPPAWQAELVSTSFNEEEVAPGGAFTVEAVFKNTGSATWHNDDEHFIALNVTGPPGRTSPFRHIFWPSYYRPNLMTTEEVAPGQNGLFRFALQVPEQTGFYFEEFNLVAENLVWIEGGYLSLPITVKNPTQPTDVNPGQPNIRVGLFASEDPFIITANKQFQIKNEEGKKLATIAGGSTVEVEYLEGKYQVRLTGSTINSDSPIIFSSTKTEPIFEIVNFENACAWNSQLNDNRFRNRLEINHSDTTDKTWVINELPLELYLRGVAESGNDNPEEYLKALIIAERTYAQYHINTELKHADENFTVDATYDQVYRGYGFEERAHVVVEMVEATEGQMVTYDDEVVVTPYYSRSDGRTRSWEEVWSGSSKPWLVSVPDPACQGLEMLGHGVGLSAYGARAMGEDGSTYDEILQYYYTGIGIEDFY